MAFSKSIPVPLWVCVWLAISSAIVVLDAAFVLLRPRSFKGGDLAWPFYIYDIYINVDSSYSDLNDGFVKAQSWLNLAEAVVNVVAIFQVFRGRKSAALFVFSACLCTLWKTILFLLNEVCSGYKHTRHNDLQTFITMYLIPNGVWVLVPVLAVLTVGRNIVFLTSENRGKAKKM